MQYEEPAKPRYTVDETPASYSVTIPSRKHWAAIAFLSFWLCGWAVFEVVVPAVFIFGKFRSAAGPPPAFILIFAVAWWCGWTLLGALGAYYMLWVIAGKDIVTFSLEGLAVETRLPMWSCKKYYKLADVKNLRCLDRVETSASISWGMKRPFSGMQGCVLAFDYGARTVRFGDGLDEAEAAMILADIAKRFPQIVRGSS